MAANVPRFRGGPPAAAAGGLGAAGVAGAGVNTPPPGTAGQQSYPAFQERLRPSYQASASFAEQDKYERHRTAVLRKRRNIAVAIVVLILTLGAVYWWVSTPTSVPSASFQRMLEEAATDYVTGHPPAWNCTTERSYCQFQVSPEACGKKWGCAWVVGRGCVFHNEHQQQVWIDLGVCSSGFVDQMLGILGQIELVIAHLLPVMPIDTDVVLVAPQVVRSTQRPFAIGEDPKRSPTSYDALFNLDALAAYTSQANPRDIVARDCDAWEEDPVLRHLSRVHVVAATPDWVTGGKTGRVSTWDKECNIVAGAKGTALSRFVMARDLARKGLAKIVTEMRADPTVRKVLGLECMTGCLPQISADLLELPHLKQAARTRRLVQRRFFYAAMRPADPLERIINTLTTLLRTRYAKRQVSGTHLRLEDDVCKGGNKPGVCSITPQRVEYCMTQTGASRTGVLYVAAGLDVTTSDSFQQWRKSTPLEVVTKEELLPDLVWNQQSGRGQLGREQLAQIDMHALLAVRRFFGTRSARFAVLTESLREINGVDTATNDVWVDLDERCQQPVEEAKPAGGDAGKTAPKAAGGAGAGSGTGKAAPKAAGGDGASKAKAKAKTAGGDGAGKAKAKPAAAAAAGNDAGAEAAST